MKIIDAHLHLFGDDENSRAAAAAVGHTHRAEELLQLYDKLDIRAGVVMGNQRLGPDAYRFPDRFRYCIAVGDKDRPEEKEKQQIFWAEEHLKRDACVGIKIYAGYNMAYVSHPRFEPYYHLAAKYDKPVAIHTGMMAGGKGMLKYSHPLTVDEVACTHPKNRFILCHFGNPFLAEAAAVMEKNPNVWADLSGLLSGIPDLDRYFEKHAGYVQMLRTWIAYLNDDSRFMFGTDFPAVNIPGYIEYIARLVDPDSLEKIFFDNANRVYGLGL